MTVSLPVTLPVPTAHGKNGSAPTKGLANAPGQHKNAPGAEEATGVADIFAALVATLTAQMQPASDAAATHGATAEGEGAPVPVVAATLGEVVLPLDAAAVAETGEVAAEGAVAAPVVDAAIGATAVEVADPSALEGDAAAVAGPMGGEVSDESAFAGGEHRAMPAMPATPGQDGARADRATPAQPVQPAVIETAAPVVAAPVANPLATAANADKADTDRTVAAVPATPATATTTAAERATPAAPAARPTPPDAHVQVARIVRPLRLSQDGSYELALDLTPAELGRVRIDVELRGATIHLSLRADNPATRDLLQNSMDQLRRELEAAGLQAGNLDVGSQGANGRGAAEREQHQQGGAGSPSDSPTSETRIETSASAPVLTNNDDGLDVLA